MHENVDILRKYDTYCCILAYNFFKFVAKNKNKNKTNKQTNKQNNNNKTKKRKGFLFTVLINLQYITSVLITKRTIPLQ